MHILISGSTKGIGNGLARRFLEKGHKVTINGTTNKSVDKALSDLKYINDEKNIQGFSANFINIDEVEALCKKSIINFGEIDIWINNAGVDQPRKKLWKIETEELDKVIDINIKGVFNGSKVAMNQMLKQKHGYIYNMEGFGSDNRKGDKISLYGTSKKAVSYFTESLSLEAKDTCVKIGTLSPGMVATDFLKNSLPENKEEAKRIKNVYNILADEVEPVTTYLVDQIIKNNDNGKKIKWLTTPKVMKRFMTAKFNKRDLF